MNLLYVSNLSGNMWAGPNNSVPAQILAQKDIDNIFWYNINYNTKKEWEESEVFHNCKEYPNKRLSELPSPFSNPDLVIFEGIYTYPFACLTYEVQNLNIPYILIPRSELTKKAQKHKRYKKKIGNIIFFNRFIRKAIAIQYLTKKEHDDSGNKWNNNCIIIPNGTPKKEFEKTSFSNSQLKGIYIGRIEIYQKGLDMLVNVCENMKDELRSSNCTIYLYGPDRENAKNKLNDMINDAKISDIIKINEGVFDEEKQNVQLNSDFFIMTSKFEGHPMGLIEALSYGLPCLVTTGTNMAEEVKDSNAGWVAETNEESIAKALKKLINEKDKFKEKGKNALKLSQKYNWDTIAKVSHDEYEKLIKGKKEDYYE